MIIASFFDPRVAGQLDTPGVLATAFANYVFVIGGATVACVAAQTVWGARKQLSEARRLGQYRLTAPIGRGGMSEVWLAWDSRLKRNVALKILRGNTEADAIRRFEQEAYATSKLTSPNTIRIFDFGASDDGVSYIAMELLRGTDLAQLIKRRGALPVRQVVHFALHAAKSLKEAHTHGIVHRDIKPANLFAANVAGEPDFLKVLDFGVARIRDTEEAARTQAGVVIGTLHYIAPEGIMGQEADVRTDIYSFGATLYHLLTGRPPFAGRNTSALVAAQMYDMPPNPSVRRGETIPADLEDIVMRCLAKAPEARFQRFADVITALTKLDLPEWTPADARDAERVDESPASSETASAG
jgi:serine/threonine-protein kinase